ncbi:MAG: hypothetical protein HXY40_17965 [Chloroflexi bacterium]|nr:hypothetical protein [Chloroflexota bacterium]
MAIDFIIDHTCEPKRILGTDGIVERLKGEERAATIIAMFRKNGDNRPPSEMGFEFTRSTPEGEKEKKIVVVQDLLDAAAELKPLEVHCQGCPANRTGKRFGCIGFIQYPVSARGEAWLLNQLPVPDEALVWLLLKQGVEEFKYDGSSLAPMRQAGDSYFEVRGSLTRRLGEFRITNDQVFEMLFLLGHIQPPHAGVVLLFFHAIQRDLNADDIMRVSRAPQDAAARYPFRHTAEADDDRTISEFKGFLHALYIAWSLNVRLLLDV